jgi:hypothetical protein
MSAGSVGFLSGARGVAQESRAADRKLYRPPTERRRLGAVGPNKDSCRFPHPSHKLRANDDELRIGKVHEQPENPHKHLGFGALWLRARAPKLLAKRVVATVACPSCRGDEGRDADPDR